MFPVASGAPVEKPLAKFFFGFFGVMLLAFAVVKKKTRLLVLSVGCCRCCMDAGRPIRHGQARQSRC